MNNNKTRKSAKPMKDFQIVENNSGVIFMNKRAIGIDILKCICAFLVVCIHAPFPYFGGYFVGISRIAVPIFFIITGYFYETSREKGIRKSIFKILKLFLGANLLYFSWNLVLQILSGNNLGTYLSGIFTIEKTLKFLLLNDSPFGGHLWYLGAILYVMIIITCFQKFISWRIWYILTPILLFIDLIFGKYSILLFGKEFDIVFIRNFLFVALPYFCIGHYIYEKSKSISTKNNTVMVSAMVFFLVLNLLERYLLIQYKINATRDHYICTTFLAVSIFMLFKNLSVTDKNPANYLAHIGKNYSTIIYVIHPIFIAIISVLMRTLNNIYLPVRPILIFSVSLIFAFFYRIITNKIKLYKNR